MKYLIVLMLWLPAAMPAWADVDREGLIALSASVLKIEALRVQGGVSLGSGVVVAPEKIFTNCHVTHDAVKVDVLRGGVRWRAASQMSDVDHDLCLLRVPGLQARVVTLGRADRLKPGQPVIALGYTGGMNMQNSQGVVLALHRYDGSRVIQSSNWFNSGASGGGLFDLNLHLVGILTFRLRGREAQHFAAPAEWLRAMLDMPEGYSEVAPDRTQRLAYWQRPVSDQPRFLQAALLQRDEQWPELASMAEEWSRADASDFEPWYLMGVAMMQMDRLPEAEHALKCSLAIEPASSAAWAWLAPVYRRLGQTERAAQIQSSLGDPNALPGQASPLAISTPCAIDTPSSPTP